MSLDDRMRRAAERVEGATMNMEVPENEVPRRARVRTITRASAGVVALVAITLLAVSTIGVTTHKHADVAKPGASAGGVGPFIVNQENPSDPHNADSHWHAALGVWNCGQWMGDIKPGTWKWPNHNAQTASPTLPDGSTYAGMHSHEDGIIHMEPAYPADAGKNATVGRYFDSGGWTVSTDGFFFLNTARHNGQPCNGEAGQISWWVNGQQMHGDPASYKLYDNDTVVIAYLPQSHADAYPGNPPSVVNLPSEAGALNHFNITADSGGALKFVPSSFNATTGIAEIDLTTGAAGHSFTFADPAIHFSAVNLSDSRTTTKAYLFFAKPGDYQFMCTIPGHAAAGETGVIHVTGSEQPLPHNLR
jgi:hypothetical protein